MANDDEKPVIDDIIGRPTGERLAELTHIVAAKKAAEAGRGLEPPSKQTVARRPLPDYGLGPEPPRYSHLWYEWIETRDQLEMLAERTARKSL